MSIVWEADELDESEEFLLHDVTLHATAIINGEMHIGISEPLEGCPILNGENPTDEDLMESGHIEELTVEALENLKDGMAQGLPIEREISAALTHIRTTHPMMKSGAVHA